MRSSYGSIEIAKENILLKNTITPTRTGTCDILENQAPQDVYGNPADSWVAIASGITCAINHHSDTTGNIVGPVIITPNRFVATLPVGTVIESGNRILFESEYFHVDSVDVPLSIDVAVTAYLTLV